MKGTIEWLGITWWSWPPQDLPMFWATLAAASVALAYVILTSRLVSTTRASVNNAWKANQAGLLKALLEEHAGLASDIDKIHAWWKINGNAAIKKYEQDLRASHRPEPTAQMHESRKRVSQFFFRVRVLCEKGMLDSELVAATVGREPVQVFLRYIDPLDEIVRRVRVPTKGHNIADREYFHRYLEEHFPADTDGDPWGLRQTAA